MIGQFKFALEDMEQVAEQFLTQKVPTKFLDMTGRTGQDDCTLFDILLQEEEAAAAASDSNEHFVSILLDIIERKSRGDELTNHNQSKVKYKQPSDEQFCKITLLDRNLERLTQAVIKNFLDLNDDDFRGTRTVRLRVFNCLALDKEQCLKMFDMMYKHNNEQLALFMFDNCLWYQDRGKLKRIVRLHFSNMCERKWKDMSVKMSWRALDVDGDDI
jgi:hypothetical protein